MLSPCCLHVVPMWSPHPSGPPDIVCILVFTVGPDSNVVSTSLWSSKPTMSPCCLQHCPAYWSPCNKVRGHMVSQHPIRGPHVVHHVVSLPLYPYCLHILMLVPMLYGMLVFGATNNCPHACPHVASFHSCPSCGLPHPWWSPCCLHIVLMLSPCCLHVVPMWSALSLWLPYCWPPCCPSQYCPHERHHVKI